MSNLTVPGRAHTGPTRSTGSPSAVKQARQRPTSPGSPLAITIRRPAAALETGASTKATPRTAARAARRRLVVGSAVLWAAGHSRRHDLEQFAVAGHVCFNLRVFWTQTPTTAADFVGSVPHGEDHAGRARRSRLTKMPRHVSWGPLVLIGSEAQAVAEPN